MLRVKFTLEFFNPALIPAPFERKHVWRYMPVVRGSAQESPATGVVVSTFLDSFVAQVEPEEPLGENDEWERNGQNAHGQ
jgi:hypothetical protein